MTEIKYNYERIPLEQISKSLLDQISMAITGVVGEINTENYGKIDNHTCGRQAVVVNNDMMYIYHCRVNDEDGVASLRHLGLMETRSVEH